MKKKVLLTIIYLVPFILFLILLLIYSIPFKDTNVYSRIAEGNNISILIAGDSIGRGSGASRPENNFVGLVKTFLTQKYAVDSIITNISMGGNNSYAELIRVSQISNKEDFNLVIVCCGQNDDNSITLAKYYESLICSIKTKWPNAKIISILQSSQKGYTDKIKCIQTIANYYNILTADTINPFINGSNGEYNTLTIDGIHPNDRGYSIYAKVLEELIDTEVKKSNKTIKLVKYFLYYIKFFKKWNLKTISPLFNESLEYYNFTEISTNSMIRDNNSFKFCTNMPKNSHLGIDFDYKNGINNYEIYINNNLIFNKNFKWEWGIESQRHIMELGKINNEGVCNILINFQREDQANSFKKLFITYPND